MTAALSFRVALPAPFSYVPPRPSAAFDEWAAQALASRAGEASTLGVDLQRLAAAMEADRDPEHHWFVAVTAPPYRLGIAAFGWVSAGAAHGVTAEALAAQVPGDGVRDDSESLISRASIHPVGANTALVINHLQPVDAEPTTLLIERCGALLLVPAADVLVRLEFVALDMRAFDDIVQTTLRVLESVAVTAAGE